MLLLLLLPLMLQTMSKAGKKKTVSGAGAEDGDFVALRARREVGPPSNINT